MTAELIVWRRGGGGGIFLLAFFTNKISAFDPTNTEPHDAIFT